MSLVKLILVVYVCLHVSGVSPETLFNYRYYTLGVNASLPCDRLAHYGPNCSRVDWLYYNDLINSPLALVSEGQLQESPRSTRFSLKSDCSLDVHSVSVEDIGLYACRQPGRTDVDTNVYLSVLTVSPVPNQDGLLTLQCTVRTFIGLSSCHQGSIRWSDIHGAVLTGAGVSQNNCVSNLTVERYSEHNRRYTCQFVDLLAHYSPEVKSVSKSDVSDPVSSNICVEAAAVLSLLVLHLFQNNV